MAPMTEEERNEALARYPGIDPEIGIDLVACDELRASEHKHAELQRRFAEERERLERLYFGRRFILIRF